MLARGKKKKRDVDLAGLVATLSVELERAFAEQTGPMSRQGISGALQFGRVTGMILGVLMTRRIPSTFVSPAQWKRALAVPKATGLGHRNSCRPLPGSGGLPNITGAPKRRSSPSMGSASSAARPSEGLGERHRRR
jgi:hypothetical protein